MNPRLIWSACAVGSAAGVSFLVGGVPAAVCFVAGVVISQVNTDWLPETMEPKRAPGEPLLVENGPMYRPINPAPSAVHSFKPVLALVVSNVLLNGWRRSDDLPIVAKKARRALYNGKGSSLARIAPVDRPEHAALAPENVRKLTAK